MVRHAVHASETEYRCVSTWQQRRDLRDDALKTSDERHLKIKANHFDVAKARLAKQFADAIDALVIGGGFFRACAGNSDLAIGSGVEPVAQVIRELRAIQCLLANRTAHRARVNGDIDGLILLGIAGGKCRDDAQNEPSK